MKIRTSHFEFNFPDEIKVEKIDIGCQQEDFFKSPFGKIFTILSRFVWRSEPNYSITHQNYYLLKVANCNVNISSVLLDAKSPDACEMLKEFMESQTRSHINVEVFKYNEIRGAQCRYSNDSGSSIERWYKKRDALLQVSIMSNEATESEVDQIADQVLDFLEI